SGDASRGAASTGAAASGMGAESMDGGASVTMAGTEVDTSLAPDAGATTEAFVCSFTYAIAAIAPTERAPATIPQRSPSPRGRSRLDAEEPSVVATAVVGTGAAPELSPGSSASTRTAPAARSLVAGVPNGA